MKIINYLLLLSGAAAGRIKGGFTEDKMCVDVYNQLENTKAIKDFYTTDWEQMKRECRKAFNDQDMKGCAMVGEGNGGYCLLYDNSEFASYDTVYFDYVMKTENITAAEARIWIE